MPVDVSALEEVVRHLAGLERPSASPGEHEAARWIAGRLAAEGCRAEVEEEPAHGTYWWPLGLLSAIGAAAGTWALRHPGRGRGAVAAVGFATALAIADDVTASRMAFRRLLRRRRTWNVVAEAGDPRAPDTVVLVAHHDAAHTGIIFHPALSAIGDRFPDRPNAKDGEVSAMVPVIAAPALVAVGAITGWPLLLRAGVLVSGVCVGVFVNVGRGAVVPAANDNATGVATLVGVAQDLRARPVDGLRVLLVSTGAEESFMEGMRAFGARHFPDLPVARTRFVCVDSVGSPQLNLLEAVGMVRVRDYPADFKDLVSDCARQTGVDLMRGLRGPSDTDGLISMRAGYPTVMVSSIDRHEEPSRYHWPTDTPENVDFGTVADAVRLCDAVVRRLADGTAAGPA